MEKNIFDIYFRFELGGQIQYYRSKNQIKEVCMHVYGYNHEFLLLLTLFMISYVYVHMKVSLLNISWFDISCMFAGVKL